MPVVFFIIIAHNFYMANSTIENIKNNIKKYRIARGLTQYKLAILCNMSPDYISEIERGRKIPSLKRLIMIAEQLEVTIGQLADNK